MDKITLKLFPAKDYALVTQMSQFISVGFSFVNKDYEEIMQHVMCKDFMNVPNWQRKFARSAVSIYGWTYDFAKTPYDVDVTRISFAFTHQDQADNFIKNIGYLNAIEKKYGIKPTIQLATQEANIIVVEGDPVWQSNCWKMSLYMTYLRRLGHNDPTKPESSSDKDFMIRMASLPNFEHNLLTNIHKDYDFIEKSYDTGYAHSASGIMNLHSYAKYINPLTGELVGAMQNRTHLYKHAISLGSIGAIPNPNFKSVSQKTVEYA